MAIKSAPYYWVECDGCGNKVPALDGPEVWETKELAEYAAEEEDFEIDGDRHLCLDCVLDRSEEEHP